MRTPATILKETFGYDTFRPLQREVIKNVLAIAACAWMPVRLGRLNCRVIPKKGNKILHAQDPWTADASDCRARLRSITNAFAIPTDGLRMFSS